MFGILFLVFASIALVVIVIFKRIYAKTSTMAIVMTVGILIEGIMTHPPIHSLTLLSKLNHLMCDLTFLIWLFLMASYLYSLTNGKFKKLHFGNPIDFFGVGTWIAGTSICGLLITKFYRGEILLSKLLFLLNAFIWLLYIFFSIKILLNGRKFNLSNQGHGILLLSTVSTQSLVILMNTIWSSVPNSFNISLILFGLVLYSICFFYIFSRYSSRMSSKKIADQWKNTNCIIHGALSITGLASMVTHILPVQTTIIFWLFVTFLFLLIESIELYRGFVRINFYGYQSLFKYDLSQWSRLFTFGMYYKFCTLVHPVQGLLKQIHMIILMGVFCILVSLIAIECILFFKDSLSRRKIGHLISQQKDQ